MKQMIDNKETEINVSSEAICFLNILGNILKLLDNFVIVLIFHPIFKFFAFYLVDITS